MSDFDRYQKEAFSLAGTTDTRMFGLGITGEAGEVAELVKKAVYHAKAYPLDEMIKELGDVLWYVSGMAAAHNVSLSTVADANLAKLRARYPNGFVNGGGNRG